MSTDSPTPTFLELVTEHYLESSDFKGLSLHILGDLEPDVAVELREWLKTYIETNNVVIRTRASGNPHIRAYGDDDTEKMLELLSSSELEDVVVYPSRSHLEVVLSRSEFADRPYTRELALGAGQLDYRAFDVAVLEWYRNDPRYEYETNDWGGYIAIKDEFFQSEDVPERDQVILKTFGFCFNDAMHRAVAVYCAYLADLSPEHQQVWKARELHGDYRLHPEYYRTTILGDWPEGLSMFDALLQELEVINEMANAMGRESLFRKNFKGERPANFTFLVRPTQDEFNSFVLTLDKMLSDNINKKFFGSDVPAEKESTRKDGKVVVQPQGTIAMLEAWIRSRVRVDDPTPIDDMFRTIREVRNLRQQPAHALNSNVFDRALMEKQRTLMNRTYDAIRTLRLLLANHPVVASANIEISRELWEGKKIWTY